MSKNPCRQCKGRCSDAGKERCWQWIGYDRDRLAGENKRLKRLIMDWALGKSKQAATIKLTAAAFDIAEAASGAKRRAK